MVRNAALRSTLSKKLAADSEFVAPTVASDINNLLNAEGFIGVQPSVGDSVDRYHGWADGNPDLLKADRSGTNGCRLREYSLLLS